MDMLKYMFERQNDLQTRLGTWEKLEDDKDMQSFINQNAIAIYEEMSEILRCTPYKNPNYVKFGWKKGQVWNDELYLEEIVDMFHFVMNLCLAKGITAEKFYECYCNKNRTNHQRQEENY